MATRSCNVLPGSTRSRSKSAAPRPRCAAPPGRNAPNRWSPISKPLSVSSASGCSPSPTWARRSPTWPTIGKGICVYLDDGRVEMDSNPVENLIRPLDSQQKECVYSRPNEGAQNWARLASLIGTCKLNGVEPFAYSKPRLRRSPPAIATPTSTPCCRGISARCATQPLHSRQPRSGAIFAQTTAKLCNRTLQSLLQTMLPRAS